MPSMGPAGRARRSRTCDGCGRRWRRPEGMLRVGVVGTNGKTSTADLSGATADGERLPDRAVLVAPTRIDWTERVRVDDLPCDPYDLLATVTEVHELARSVVGDLGQLRFFDVLTLAAERLILESGAVFGVFEAGIGGRLDAVRVLEPPIVLLTSVANDHAEILGEELADVLREKLLVAPAGATVVSTPLADDLVALAERIAAERDLLIVWISPPSDDEPGPDVPAYLRSALALAERGLAAVGDLGLMRPKAAELRATLEMLQAARSLRVRRVGGGAVLPRRCSQRGRLAGVERGAGPARLGLGRGGLADRPDSGIPGQAH